MTNRAAALAIRLNRSARRTAKHLLAMVDDPTCHHVRPQLIRRLRAYLKHDLTPITRHKVLHALRQAYYKDQRHWSEWDVVRGALVDPYTGEPEESEYAWQHMRAGDYLRFDVEGATVKVRLNGTKVIHAYPVSEFGGEAGETLGYRQLQKLIDIVEEHEPPSAFREVRETHVNLRTGETQARVYSAAIVARYNGRTLMPMEAALPLEDRGYEPPSFAPEFTVNWDDVQNAQKAHSEAFGHIVRSSIEVLDKTPRTCVLGPLKVSVLNVPYLSRAENYYLLQHVARQIAWGVSDKLVRRFLDRNELAGWIHDTLVHYAGLDTFADAYADELDTFDPAPHRVHVEEADIVDDARELNAYAEAPILRMKRAQLVALWHAREHDFPSAARIRSETQGDCSRVYVTDPRDWRSVQKLLALVGITVDERVAKSQTPRFIAAALRTLVSGGSVKQAYRQAWKEFYTMPRREVAQQPHVITGVDGPYLWVARGPHELRIHHQAIGRFNATIDPSVQDDILAEFPNLVPSSVT